MLGTVEPCAGLVRAEAAGLTPPRWVALVVSRSGWLPPYAQAAPRRWMPREPLLESSSHPKFHFRTEQQPDKNKQYERILTRGERTICEH